MSSRPVIKIRTAIRGPLPDGVSWWSRSRSRLTRSSTSTWSNPQLVAIYANDGGGEVDPRRQTEHESNLRYQFVLLSTDQQYCSPRRPRWDDIALASWSTNGTRGGGRRPALAQVSARKTGGCARPGVQEGAVGKVLIDVSAADWRTLGRPLSGRPGVYLCEEEAMRGCGGDAGPVDRGPVDASQGRRRGCVPGARRAVPAGAEAHCYRMLGWCRTPRMRCRRR